ncbi:MAG: 50S ribosomal protein L5 [Candidatus Aenigmatarchaeota archaeon]|nr:MAG: 50S ribosomal protein L5 [Candidatus Aenigmarchaeota archaeon]
MKTIRIEKVTLNMSTGSPGPELEKARKLLEMITGSKIVKTRTRKRSTFGVAKGREIGVMTTLRGPEARELLEKLFHSKDNKISASQFDKSGNFSIGVEEYINIPGVNYDPDIGIMGFDVTVSLERPGYRVSKRSYRRSKVGKAHRITQEEAMDWVKREFGVEIV